MIEHVPLAWWVKWIKESKNFSLARFGDGEILCMQGRKGGNSHGCAYTPELRADLIATANDARLIRGIQRILPSQLREFREYTDRGGWFDTEVFCDELAVGRLRPFFEALKGKHIVIVSSEEKMKVPPKLIDFDEFVITPRTNTHAEKDRIIKDCQQLGPATFLFACGMAAGPLVHALHGTIPNSQFIDIGHILDPFVGEMSREYMKTMSRETLMANYP